MSDSVCISAPGRLCLFGEHQDFLGLSVIACAIDRDIKISATRRTDSFFRIQMPDIGAYDEFDGARELEYLHKRDYIRSAVNVMRRQGLAITCGYDVTIRGTIPINAGTASSSALVVAWVKFLIATQPGEVADSAADIARYAYLAEVVEFREPGGMMDHYTSSLGGLLHIDCMQPVSVAPLNADLDGFVLGESLVPKDTTSVLQASRMATMAGFKLLARRIPGFDIRMTPLEQAEEFFPEMPPETRRLVRAQFINRDLCRQARHMLQDNHFDSRTFGQMLLEHHARLRDGLRVSHPKLDALIEASLKAGALGGKLNGSGLGGCMFAYAPGCQEQVKQAIDAAGGRGHVVKLRGGVCHVDEH